MTNKDAPGVQLNSGRLHWTRDYLRAMESLGYVINRDIWYNAMLKTAEDKV